MIVGVFVQPDRVNNNHTDKKEDGEAERSTQGVGVRVGDWFRFIQAWKEFWVGSEVTSPCERGLFFTLEGRREKSGS